MQVYILRSQDEWLLILPCFVLSFKIVEHATAVFRALPLLFPSSTMPPEKMGASSEAVFHVHTVRQVFIFSVVLFCGKPLSFMILEVSQSRTRFLFLVIS